MTTKTKMNKREKKRMAPSGGAEWELFSGALLQGWSGYNSSLYRLCKTSHEASNAQMDNKNEQI